MVAGTIIISFVIYTFGGYFSQSTGEFYSLDWLSGYFALGDITVKEVIFTAFLGAFFSRPELNSPLWTIKYEFVALSIIHALVLMVYKWNYRRVLYIITILLLSIQFEIAGFETIYIACILSGILISDFYYNSGSEACMWNKLKSIKGQYFVLIICIIYGLTLFNRSVLILRMLTVILILIGLLIFQSIQKFFRKKILVWLGNLSFEIYAVHWPIICSIGCWLMLNFFKNTYFAGTIITYIITLILSIGCGIILKKVEFGVANIFSEKTHIVSY